MGSARTHDAFQYGAVQHFEEGRWDEALTGLTALIEDTRVEFSRSGQASTRGFAAMIHAHRGQPAAARDRLAALDQLFAGTFSPFLIPATLARAIVAEQEEGTAAALAVLEPILYDELDLPRANWHMVLPEVLRLAHATDRHDLDAKVTAILSVEGGDSPLVKAGRLHCRALLDQDPESGLEAARILAGWPINAASCLENTADLLAPTDQARARETLTEAIDLYESMGAVVDMARAESRLRAHGVRLGVRGARRRRTHGWTALTPAEVKVAALVAEGMTNPAIAARMFLSRRTVQTHVSQILAKLDIASRRDIARFVAEATNASAT